MFLLDAGLEKKLTKVKITHSRKLKNLGVDLAKKIDGSKVISYFSNIILSDEEKEVLSLGLDFALPSINVNFVKYFLNFERLCNLLKSCSLYGDSSINMIFNRIATVAGDSYRKVCKQSKELKGNKVVENRMKILKDLKEDSSIHITKPDKGRGVVVLNKTDYESKMNYILSDATKFTLLDVDITTHIVKLEDKLHRILRGRKERI